MISMMKIAAAVGVAVLMALPAPQAAKSGQKPSLRVLVVTGGHGFERDPFFAMFKGDGRRHLPGGDAACRQ